VEGSLVSELETKLLARLTDPVALAEVHDFGVRTEAFEQPLHQAIYAFIVRYWQESGSTAAPTPWVITQEFPGVTLTDDSQETTSYLAELLQRRAATNRVQEALREAAKTANLDPIGTLKSLHAHSFEALEIITPRVTRENMADTVTERRQDYETLDQYPMGIGIPYGLDLIDIHTGGCKKGELAVVGAVAKTGKTMFGLHCATQMVRQGFRPMVFSLEMSIKECRARMDAFFSGVSYHRIVHGLTEEDKAVLYPAQDALAQLGGIQIERPDEGDRTVAAILARARQYGADWIFVDQLSHMEAGHKTYSRKEEYSSILKQLSTGISRPGSEVACLLAAQMKRGEDEISQESFADAAEVEREADICFGLYRTVDMIPNQTMACQILAARRSAPRKWLLDWQLDSCSQIRPLQEVRG
jgi:replicative DNA helicase